MKPRLLVAEKDSPLREVFQMALEYRGYEVDTAADVEECMTKLLTRGADALLLDRELLSGGGDALVDCLRRGSSGPTIPVVLMAGAGSSGVLAGLVVPPVVACLQKPFRFRVLLEILASATGPGSACSPKKPLRRRSAVRLAAMTC